MTRPDQEEQLRQLSAMIGNCGGAANDYLLTDIGNTLGMLAVPNAEVRALLDELCRRGLVTINRVNDLMVVKLKNGDREGQLDQEDLAR